MAKQITVTGIIPTAVAGKNVTVKLNDTKRIRELIEAGYLSVVEEPTADDGEDE